MSSLSEPEEAVKKCGGCREVLPLSAFHKDKGRKTGRCWECKVCARSRFKILTQRPDLRERRLAIQNARQRTPEGRAAQRAKHLRLTYGITPADFDALYAAQTGQCAICSEQMAAGCGTHIDHCHTSGRVRALLCMRCNTQLGFYESRPGVHHLFPAYLAKHRDAHLACPVDTPQPHPTEEKSTGQN